MLLLRDYFPYHRHERVYLNKIDRVANQIIIDFILDIYTHIQKLDISL